MRIDNRLTTYFALLFSFGDFIRTDREKKDYYTKVI